MNTPSKVWREAAQRYRYEAAQCTACDRVCFPPRLICPSCQGRDFKKIILNRRGKLLTYTVIRIPPPQFKAEAPYALGIVELEGGGKLTTQIVDCNFEDLAIGMELNLEFRRVQEDGEAGVIAYGYKCVPI